MILRSTRTAATIVAGCLAAVGAQAQSPFAKALPNDTIAFLSFPDISKSIEEMRQAPIAKMWHEEEVQDFVADAMAMLDARWEELEQEGQALFESGDLPFDPTDLSKLELHSVGVALTSLAIGKFEEDPFPLVGIVALAELGESAPIWRGMFDVLLQRLLTEADGELSITEWKAGETEVRSLGAAEVEFPIGLHVAFHGSQLVVSSKRDELEAFLSSLESGANRLAATKDYGSCAQVVRVDGAEVEAFFRPNPLIDFAMSAVRIAQSEGELPPFVDLDGIERAIAVLGLRSIDAIGGISAYEGGRCVARSFVASPKDRRCGLTDLVSGDADLSLLRWVPKDAATLSIGSLNVAAIYDAVVGALNAYDPEMAKSLLGELAAQEEQIGVSVKNDIFGAFDGRFVTWQLPMASFTAAPEMAVVAKMSNQDGFLNALQKAAAMSQGRIVLEENERRGIKVYQLIFDIEVDGEIGFNPLTMFVPTFSFKDDYLVLAFSTSDIKRAFKRMDREDDPAGDIRSNAEFAPYLQSLPAEGLTSLSFRDWKAEFEAYYQVGTTALAFVPLDDEIPIDLSLLPDSSTLTQHLCGSMTWTRQTDAGTFSSSVGPWGPETIALLSGAIAGGAGAAVFMGSADARMSGW